MSCVIFALTDEHPEIRLFIASQGLNLLFAKTIKLQTPVLAGVVLKDSNEFLTMHNLIGSLTAQALTFEEISQDPKAIQTERFAQMDAIQSGQQVASGFPGIDFYLTEIQLQLLFGTEFLEELLTRDFYRENLELNFDDKIFFHEPINKYFDLLWIRKLAW